MIFDLHVVENGTTIYADAFGVYAPQLGSPSHHSFGGIGLTHDAELRVCGVKLEVEYSRLGTYMLPPLP
jgi:hypothetical protein